MSDAVVIPFPKHAARSSQASVDVNGPAQIIIFPGVRYMHLMDEEEDLFAVATAPFKRPSKGKK